MKVKIKKTETIVDVIPNYLKAGYWIDAQGNDYKWEDFDPCKVQVGHETLQVRAIPIKIGAVVSGVVE